MSIGRGEDGQKVRGSNCGADEYLLKPINPADLTASIRRLFQTPPDGPVQDILQFDDVRMDLTAHRVLRNGRPIHVGPSEFRLLRFLLSHPGQAFSREQLLDAVWGHDANVLPRTVDVHILRLRKALDRPGLPDLVRTVPWVGYALEIDDCGATELATAEITAK